LPQRGSSNGRVRAGGKKVIPRLADYPKMSVDD
jgi:hypothetical protein